MTSLAFFAKQIQLAKNSWKNGKNKSIIQGWMHKERILRGSLESWGGIIRTWTSEGVWKWPTPQKPPCVSSWALNTLQGNSSDFLAMIHQTSAISVWTSSSCVQLLSWKIHLRLYPSEQQKLSFSKAILAFYADLSDFSGILSEPRTQHSKAPSAANSSVWNQGEKDKNQVI